MSSTPPTTATTTATATDAAPARSDTASAATGTTSAATRSARTPRRATATRRTATAHASNPFQFFALRVLRSQRLSRSLLRVTLGGEELRRFASAGRDQRIKLFLPHPHQEAPVLPVEADELWFPRWQAMDPAERAVMRSYTIREQRRMPDEVDIDFALHGDTGPASRWAARARPGDQVTLLGPVAEDNAGMDFRPPPDADWVLLAADETALPAVAGILDWLPPGTRARVWIEVPHTEDQITLSTRADATITWLSRDQAPGPRSTELLPNAIRNADLPGGTPYAWIAGESAMVRSLRRHLVRERQIDRRRVKFTGYWRLGATEEDLLNEAVATGNQSPKDD